MKPSSHLEALEPLGVWLGRRRACIVWRRLDRGWTKAESLARFQRRQRPDDGPKRQASDVGWGVLGRSWEAAHVAQICRDPMAGRALPFNKLAPDVWHVWA